MHATRSSFIMCLGLFLSAVGLLSGCSSKPHKPGNLKVTAGTDNSFVLQWADSSTNEDGFIVEIDKGDGSVPLRLKTGSGQERQLVTGLEKQRAYGVTVCAFNAGGKSDVAGPVFCTTSVSASGSVLPEGLPITANGLAAYWPLNEGGGNTATDSVNTLRGQVVGTTVVDGVQGRARSFAGTSYIEVPDGCALDIDNAITLMMWVKMPKPLLQGYLLSKRTAGTNNINYSLVCARPGNNDQVEFQYAPGGPVSVNRLSPVVGLSDGLWHHIAYSYVFGNSQSAFWVYDGRRMAGTWTLDSGRPGGGDQKPSVNSGPLEIGRQLSSSPGQFSGDLDQIRIYGRALSEDEIRAIYASEMARPEQMVTSTATPPRQESAEQRGSGPSTQQPSISGSTPTAVAPTTVQHSPAALQSLGTTQDTAGDTVGAGGTISDRLRSALDAETMRYNRKLCMREKSVSSC